MEMEIWVKEGSLDQLNQTGKVFSISRPPEHQLSHPAISILVIKEEKTIPKHAESIDPISMGLVVKFEVFLNEYHHLKLQNLSLGDFLPNLIPQNMWQPPNIFNNQQ